MVRTQERADRQTQKKEIRRQRRVCPELPVSAPWERQVSRHRLDVVPCRWGCPTEGVCVCLSVKQTCDRAIETMQKQDLLILFCWFQDFYRQLQL